MCEPKRGSKTGAVISTGGFIAAIALAAPAARAASAIGLALIVMGVILTAAAVGGLVLLIVHYRRQARAWQQSRRLTARVGRPQIGVRQVRAIEPRRVYTAAEVAAILAQQKERQR